MDVGLLFSGGKDSSLAALLLDRFYEVHLVTAHFGITDDWRHAEHTAEMLDLPFEALVLDEIIAKDAVDQMLSDGYPRNGIQAVHMAALEAIARKDFDAVADGTRRDDRVPTVSRAHAQRLEDTHDIDYIAPLSGFGRSAVDALVDRHFDVTIGPSATIDRADYEAELRALIVEQAGEDAIDEIFPEHEQTAVVGRR